MWFSPTYVSLRDNKAVQFVIHPFRPRGAESLCLEARGEFFEAVDCVFIKEPPVGAKVAVGCGASGGAVLGAVAHAQWKKAAGGAVSGMRILAGAEFGVGGRG